MSDRPRRIFFLGIGGTLMGSLALLAREMGFDVAGCDNVLYPPMSDQLADADVTVHEGFEPSQLKPAPDLVVIGNAQLPRGHAAVEAVLDRNLPYVSGAEWLGTQVLRGRWTLAAAGTHGKTTTASMLAHILDCAGLDPGFLIGGVPTNFGRSSRLGSSDLFVVEADEYDTSYFDRRSKFVHYRPRTLVINNIEFDHADIFRDVGEIKAQFHQLVRTVPATGLIIAPRRDRNVNDMLGTGCWTPVARVGGQPGRGVTMDNGEYWHARGAADGSSFDVHLNDEELGSVSWHMLGKHNVDNALGAIAAARHAGVAPGVAIDALGSFDGIKRRLEVVARRNGLVIYDDFAHHPTAIRATLQGLRHHVGEERVIAVLEPRTHTMSLGTLRGALAACCAAADEAIWFRSENIRWDLSEVAQASVYPASVEDNMTRLVNRIVALADSPQPAHVVLMSNGAFGGIYATLRKRLDAAA